MNNFNPDQKPIILNSPELPEGGDNLGGEATVESGEGREEAKPDLNIENLASLIDQAAENVQNKKEETSFETDPDTGLSLQGTRIEELKAQLEAIQKGETSEIDNPILAERSKDKEILLANLEDLNNIKIAIDKQIQDRGESVEDLMKASPELAQKLEFLKSQLTEAEKTLAQYEEETKRQLLEARQLAESQIQSKLESTQEAYVGSEAELSDRKILLEMGLQDNLTNPDQLFSEQNIQQVFDIYGLQKGLERSQQLRKESNKAREQAAKAEIQTDIFKYAFDYQNNPDLAKALDKDIEAKLQILQQQNPDSGKMSEALRLQGQSRLGYLSNSVDPELQKLAFWFSEGRGDKTEAEILAENPNFAKYVEQQTEERYAKKQLAIKEGRLGGRDYLGSQADIKLQQYIDTRIEEQFTRAKTDKLQSLRTELTSLQYDDENGAPFDSLDQSMLDSQKNIAEIDKFQAELAQSLQDGKVKFEKGIFSSVEDIPAQNQEINQELAKLLDTTKPLLEMAGYAIQSLDGLPGVLDEINKKKKAEEQKLFRFGNGAEKALEKLAGVVSEAMKQYTQLQTEKQSNITKFQESNTSLDDLKQAYNKLPKSIQDKLSVLENPSLDNITQAITTGVEYIQNYQTPAEITERRKQIASIESQIAETEAITVPTTQAIA